jgi:hypothetical protein
MAFVRRCHHCHASLDTHTAVAVTVDAEGTYRHGVGPRDADAAPSQEEPDRATHTAGGHRPA